ncbi:TPA_asm: hypothetical protein [Altiarchaeum virus]|nr:TPA_asm: hypothetical protein [Altiarchaeum virus]
MQGISIRGVQGRYTVSGLEKKIKSLENQLERAKRVLGVLQKEKPVK